MLHISRPETISHMTDFIPSHLQEFDLSFEKQYSLLIPLRGYFFSFLDLNSAGYRCQNQEFHVLEMILSPKWLLGDFKAH